MKRYLIFFVPIALLLCSCASDRGGTSDDYQTDTGTSYAPANVSPGPAATPSFPPGNPNDPRDPHFMNRPGSTPSNSQP